MSNTTTPTSTATQSQVPMMPPPPGQTSNFVNPPDLGWTIDITQITLMTITCLATILRIGALAFFKRPFWWDDGVYFFAFTCAIGRMHFNLTRKKSMAPISCSDALLTTAETGFRHSWDIPKPKKPQGVGPRVYKVRRLPRDIKLLLNVCRGSMRLLYWNHSRFTAQRNPFCYSFCESSRYRGSLESLYTSPSLSLLACGCLSWSTTP